MRQVLGVLLAIALLLGTALTFAVDSVEYDARKQAYYQAVEQYQSGIQLSGEQIALIKEFGYSPPANPAIDNFGGPDDLGYSWKDSEEPDGPDYNWIDITGTGTSFQADMSDDNIGGPYSMGFSFPFYDQLFTDIWIGSNGAINFDGDYISLGNVMLPSATHGAHIAAFNDDLDPGNNPQDVASLYELVTIGDQQVFVISCINWDEYPGNGDPNAQEDITFQYQLWDDGTIELHYMNVEAPGFDITSSTIGIQSPDRTVGLTALYNGSIVSYPYNELAIQFYRADPNASVSGVVSNSETGVPIIGAEIQIGNGFAISGDGGAYTIEGLYAGVLDVSVSAAGYFSYYSSAIVAEGVNEINFELDALPPPQTSDYFTDFEDGQGFLFSEGTATNTWTYGEPTFEPNNAWSGTFAWVLGLNTDYDNNMDEWLETATSWFITSPESYIAYWHWFSFESSYDGYYLAASTDDGDTWTVLYPDQGYTEDDGIWSNEGQPVFNNTGEREENWEYVSFSLADYVDQWVWFGWRATSDGSVRYPGACIDDLEIYVGQEPGPDAVLDLIPISTTIPPDGGQVVYDASFISEFPMTIPNLDFWTWAQTPSGELVGPLSRIGFNHTPFMNVFVTGMTLDVPAFAEGGEYIFNGAVGRFPNNPQRQDSFTFVKIGAATASTPADPYDPLHWQHSAVEWIAADGSEDAVVQLPAEYALGSAYPNPFNPSTSFTVALPESAELQVSVFNVQGRLVANIYNGEISAGEHSFTFDGHGLASGIYFIQAQVPNELNSMQKVTLMK